MSSTEVTPPEESVESLGHSENPAKRQKLEPPLQTTKTIQNLPTHLTEEIFKYLNVFEKKRVKEICLLWNKLIHLEKLSRDIVFRFRDIKLSEKHAPFSVITASTLEMLNIELNITSLPDANVEESALTHEFFEKIGENAKFLKLNGLISVSENQKSLKHFPRVEVLDILDMEVLERLIEIPSSIVEIHVSTFRTVINETSLGIIQHLPNLRNIKGQKMSFTFRDTSEQPIYNFKEMSQELCRVGIAQNVFLNADTNLLITQRLDADHVKLGLKLMNIQDISYFTLPLLSCISELEFTIANKVQPCWFIHGFVQLENVRRLKLVNHLAIKDSCKQCPVFFNESCKFATCIELHSNCLTNFKKTLNANQNFKEITVITKLPMKLANFFEMGTTLKIKRFHYLKTLKLSRISAKNPDEWAFWPALPYLQRLSIDMEAGSTFIGIETIAKKCPNMRVFHFNSCGLSLVQDQLEEILKHWPCIEELKINLDYYFCRQDGLVDIFAKYCKELRTIKLISSCYSEHVKEAVEVKLFGDLFRQIPSLREIFSPEGRYFRYFDYYSE